MKKQKKQKMKFTWGSLEFNDPYRVIKEAFFFADIESHRNFIRDVLWHCTTDKLYNKYGISDIIYWLEGINCLLQACFVISKEKKCSLLEVKDGDMLNCNFYSLRKEEAGIWSDFPRSLARAEMLDPYKAFGKIFKHNSPDKWYDKMKYLVGEACGKYSDALEENPLEVYVQLTKLYEAAHLINVREIAHVRNWRHSKTDRI